MSIYRESTAWLNASRMSGTSYMFVEGVSDENFWKRFINKTTIRIQQVNGWENVAKCVLEFNQASLNKYCIGIIDYDFESIYPYKDLTEENIFFTDYHDLEMMIILSPAWEAALTSLDRSNRLQVSHKNILMDVFEITDKIGYLKLSSLKENLRLIFKKYNKNHEIEWPKYEKFIDKRGIYEGNDKLINYFYSYTNSNTNDSIPSLQVIMEKFNKEIINKYSSQHLSNGHDVIHILVILLKRKFKLNENYISIETIEIALRSAFNYDMLKRTKIFKSIIEWTRKNKLDIFISDGSNI